MKIRHRLTGLGIVVLGIAMAAQEPGVPRLMVNSLFGLSIAISGAVFYEANRAGRGRSSR